MLLKQIIGRIQNSLFYDIIIDESMNISFTGHFVVFATIIEEGVPMTIFWRLLEIEGGKNDATIIFECLMKYLKMWDLDLCKCVAFGSDGASTMVGFHGGVATRLKKVLNPIFLCCYCVAHRTNSAALDAYKTSYCKVISDEFDTLLNAIVLFFNMSSKCKHALTALQEVFFDAKQIWHDIIRYDGLVGGKL